jgi:hypothetical protein
VHTILELTEVPTTRMLFDWIGFSFPIPMASNSQRVLVNPCNTRRVVVDITSIVFYQTCWYTC